MAKKEIKEYVKLQIKGGQANPAPPVGPALGQRGINIMEFCKAFNEKTKNFMGNPVPVVITVYRDKKFDFIIKSPPVSHFIKQALAYAYRHGIERLVVRADVWKNTYGGTYSYPEWRGKKSFSIGDIRHACARTETDVHELRDVDISALEKAENVRPPLPRKVSYNRSASSSQRDAPQWSDNRSRGEQWQWRDYDERRSDDSWVGQSSSGSGYRHEEVDHRSRGSGYRHKDYDEHRRSKDHDYKRHKDYDRRDNQRR